MIKEAYCRSMGHLIYFSEGKWYFDLTNKPYSNEEAKKLTCLKCGEKATEEGHDPCIANLPDVKFACCGHGARDFADPYIVFENDKVKRFRSTEKMMEFIEKNLDKETRTWKHKK
ncbi:MAG: hypothetical protein AABY15_02695 [Nanoarchaeota archaeon]